MGNNIHDITSFERGEDSEGDVIGEATEALDEYFVKPFWKSTVVRLGCVLVAMKVVDVAGKILLERVNAKRGL